MTLSLPLNVFTVAACLILFIYFATRIGDKQANYQHVWIVVCLSVMLLCIGLAPMSIWHMVTGGH